METNTDLIANLNALSEGMPPPLRREIRAVVHKATYPMRDILAKVPGDSLTERAKKLGVSRQTMYVWASEKFRPTRVQAKRIAKMTGVPIEQIMDDGWETNGEARRKARKKTTRVAARRKVSAKHTKHASSKGRSKAPARKHSGAA